MGWGWAWDCCCAPSANAYCLGGADAFLATFYTTADRTGFSDELTSAVTTADLSQARGSAGSIGNPDTAGYVCGGRSTSTAQVATTDKLVFSTEVTSAVGGAALSQARFQLAGVSERSTKGYLAGGQTASPGPVVTADQLTYSSDTTAAQTTANLSQARAALCGVTEGTSKGYWLGGFTGTLPASARVATADKITFSTDTTGSQTTANLTTASLHHESGSDGSTKGYVAGGQTGAAFAFCNTITFSTDSTAATTSGNITRYLGSSPSGQSDGNKMFAQGGNDNVSPTTVGGHKITFATDTSAALGAGANLSLARHTLTGVSTAGL